MVKVWCPAGAEAERTLVRVPTPPKFRSPFKYFFCAPVPGKFPRTTVEVVSNYPPADYFKAGAMLVVSSRLKETLEEFRVRAEFFRLNVVRGGIAYKERTFFFLNILNCVDCLDLSRGQYSFETKPGFTHRVSQISTLAIDEKMALGHDLFRIGNGAEDIVCVSERVSDSLQERKFTGLRLVAPEAWEFGIVVD